MSAPRPYDGVRIVDLARELGSYATRLFADLGAEVIRVEPPEGRDDRRYPPVGAHRNGAPFEFLNINKKSVAVDLARPSGRAILQDLVRSADGVVYEADAAGNTLLPLITEVPGARVVTVVSYFGLTGPYSGYAGCDLVAQSLGGLAWLSGATSGPPLRIAGEQSWIVTSLYAATATAMALWDKEHRGNAHVVDVAAIECIAHSLQNTLEAFNLEGRVTKRGGEGTRDATENIFACKDGFVFLAAPLQLTSAWDSLLGWLKDEGHPGAQRLSEPDWGVAKLRATREMHAEFRRIFEDFAAGRTKNALTDAALKRKILLSPVSSIADTLSDPQLVHRGFFRKLHHPAHGRDVVMPGAPYQLSEPVWFPGRAAPKTGQDNGMLESGAKPAAAGGRKP
jgi:benzylsuccinate CoA-transferase BbsE subunit